MKTWHSCCSPVKNAFKYLREAIFITIYGISIKNWSGKHICNGASRRPNVPTQTGGIILHNRLALTSEPKSRSMIQIKRPEEKPYPHRTAHRQPVSITHVVNPNSQPTNITALGLNSNTNQSAHTTSQSATTKVHPTAVIWTCRIVR